MDTVLQMVFVTEGEKACTLTVDMPDEQLSDQQVSDAMNAILQQNVLYTTSGALQSKKSAQFITKTVREVLLT